VGWAGIVSRMGPRAASIKTITTVWKVVGEIPSSTVMILCGDKGTRLRGHTESIPKGLIEIGGMPIL